MWKAKNNQNKTQAQTKQSGSVDGDFVRANPDTGFRQIYNEFIVMYMFARPPHWR